MRYYVLAFCLLMSLAQAKISITYYSTFTLIAPKNAQSFYNAPQIPVKFALKPKLRKGDKIQLLLDNKPYGKPTSSMLLKNIPRGTHQLSAQIISPKHIVLKTSNTVTIYVHRTFVKKQSITTP